MGTASSGITLAGGHGRERAVRASDADRDRGAALIMLRRWLKGAERRIDEHRRQPR